MSQGLLVNLPPKQGHGTRAYDTGSLVPWPPKVVDMIITRLPPRHSDNCHRMHTTARHSM
eukprot:6474222-Amphidinium_carterae.1